MVVLGAKNVKSEDDVQGNPRPLPGQYHVSVSEVEWWLKSVDDEGHEKWSKVTEDEECSKIVITFEVLAGTTPGQEHRSLPESFYLTDKSIPRLQRLALALGLLKPGEPDRAVYFSEGVGRQCVIEVADNKFVGRDGKEIEGVRVAFLGFWSVNNPAVADVPKDQESLKLLGDDPPTDGDAKKPAPAAADEYPDL